MPRRAIHLICLSALLSFPPHPLPLHSPAYGNSYILLEQLRAASTNDKSQRGIYQNTPDEILALHRSQLHSGDSCRWGSQFPYSFLSMKSNLVINCSPDDDTPVTLGSSQQIIELWFPIRNIITSIICTKLH